MLERDFRNGPKVVPLDLEVSEVVRNLGNQGTVVYGQVQ